MKYCEFDGKNEKLRVSLETQYPGSHSDRLLFSYPWVTNLIRGI